MQSDSGLNRNKMEWVIQAFDDTFGKTVQLLKKPEKAGPMDEFVLCYEYIPLNYQIKFDTERKLFEIIILNKEEFIPLDKIEKYNPELTAENVRSAVLKLKNVLEKNDFCFYVKRGMHLYEKSGENYKRIKNF